MVKRLPAESVCHHRDAAHDLLIRGAPRRHLRSDGPRSFPLPLRAGGEEEPGWHLSLRRRRADHLIREEPYQDKVIKAYR